MKPPAVVYGRFVLGVSGAEFGLTAIEYYAIHAPAPTESAMKFEADADRARNQHGDAHKPKRRSMREIEWDLRIAWAKAGIDRWYAWQDGEYKGVPEERHGQ